MQEIQKQGELFRKFLTAEKYKMQDTADRLGISRQTLYSLFDQDTIPLKYIDDLRTKFGFELPKDVSGTHDVTIENNTLAYRFAFVRKKLRMTQTDFGSSLGITAQRVANIETGRIDSLNDAELSKIYELYNVNADWLIHGQGSIYTENRARMNITIIDSDILLNNVLDFGGCEQMYLPVLSVGFDYLAIMYLCGHKSVLTTQRYLRSHGALIGARGIAYLFLFKLSL